MRDDLLGERNAFAGGANPETHGTGCYKLADYVVKWKLDDLNL